MFWLAGEFDKQKQRAKFYKINFYKSSPHLGRENKIAFKKLVDYDLVHFEM